MKLIYNILLSILTLSCTHKILPTAEDDDILCELVIDRPSVINDGQSSVAENCQYPMTFYALANEVNHSELITGSYILPSEGESVYPCRVDKMGTFLERQELGMQLRSGEYQWQMYSPAYSVSEQGTVKIGNEVDFLVTPVDYISPSSSEFMVKTKPFKHLCSKINIEIRFLTGDVQPTLTLDSLYLSGLCDSAIFCPFTLQLELYGKKGDMYLRPSQWKTNYTEEMISISLIDGGVCVLPFAKTVLDVTLFFSLDGELHELPTKVEFPDLQAGFVYQVFVTLQPKDQWINVRMELSVNPWRNYSWDEQVGERGVILWIDEWNHYSWEESLGK